MADPVFVIHGVANREENAFMETVEILQEQVGPVPKLTPVYWGDLGANDAGVGVTIPRLPGRRARAARQPGTRARPQASPGGIDDPDSLAVLAALLADRPDGGVRRPRGDAQRLTWVREGIEGREAPAGRLRTRAKAPAGPDIEVIMAGVREEWPHTQWLRQVDDPALLRATGVALIGAVEEAEPAGAPARTRSMKDRKDRLKAMVRQRVRDLDRLVGTAMASVAGPVNTSLRTHVAPSTARFLGDVLIYQNDRARIHARILEHIAAVDPNLGRDPKRPVRVVGHSLGGVIAFDMATATDPLWISSLLTFGSQAPLFHVCVPRGGSLLPYRQGRLVRLPASLARWTNLWEPLDILAFVAARVFRLPDGTLPLDIPVPHLASAGLWTHSAYWESSDLAKQIDATMNGAA